MRAPILAVALTLVFACGSDTAEIIGVWKNGTDQILDVGSDLRGTLTQTNRCAPRLAMFMHRDPFDNYAIRFEPNQNVFFPVDIAEQFLPNEFFCSSRDSVPMCRFCRVDGDALRCEAPEQDLARINPKVKHDCAWVRVSTASTATIATSTAGCPRLPEESDCTKGGGAL